MMSIGIALPQLFLIAAFISVAQQLRQDNLDRVLIQSVKRLDAPAVNRLLDAGFLKKKNSG